MPGWLSAALGVLAAGVAVVWPITQFVLARQREQRNRDFDAYHRLIKELVSPDEHNTTWLHRQVAAVFELRHFERYEEVTERILQDLRTKWSTELNASILIDEIDLTLANVRRPRALADRLLRRRLSAKDS